MLKQLIKLAQRLDNNGLHAEADMVDAIVQHANFLKPHHHYLLKRTPLSEWPDEIVSSAVKSLREDIKYWYQYFGKQVQPDLILNELKSRQSVREPIAASIRQAGIAVHLNSGIPIEKWPDEILVEAYKNFKAELPEWHDEEFLHGNARQVKQRLVDTLLERGLAKRRTPVAASVIDSIVVYAKEPDIPAKVTEIADAIRRDDKDVSDEAAYRMAWETYCSYVNPGYDGCTSKGKSKRKSPKSDYAD